MGLIKQHLDRELSKDTPNKNVVAGLQVVVDRNTITLEQWRETGRFINRDHFMEEKPEETLHIDCTDVVLYYGDVYLQLLKTGFYLIEPDTKENQIKIAEELLFLKYASYFWG